MTLLFDKSRAVRASVVQRRRIGAYYTPRRLADVICKWAITRPSDSVLEPSFGGCDFIAAARDQLQLLGCATPWKNIMGADIDPFAFSVLRELGGSNADAQQYFKLGDFLALHPTDFPIKQVQALVCNPPYVRHHIFSDDQRLLTRGIRDRILPGLSMQSNLWAFFVLHGCRFLGDGGRAAWVLPQTFLYATYASDIRKYLLRHFRKVTAINISERLFTEEGADEGTTLVLADSWSAKPIRPASLQCASVETTAELDEALNRPPARNTRYITNRPTLPREARTLGEVCEFRIGMVTGDSKFFLFDGRKAASNGLGDDSLRLIVSKARLASGLTISALELESAFRTGASTKILDTTAGLTESAKAYLDLMSEESIKSNITFSKRPIWHQPFDGQIPDGFFTGMSHHGPRLIINNDRLDCTNTLYRATFSTNISLHSKRLIAVSLVSTVGQLSAEFEGRPYGAGLLKHEPSDAKRIRVFVDVTPDSKKNLIKAFSEVDRLLKCGNNTEAREQADRFLLQNGYVTAQQLSRYEKRLIHARKTRQR